MKTTRLTIYGIFLLLVIVVWAASYSKYAQSPWFSNQTDHQRSHGAYLAEEVARCGECHTPQAEPGRGDRTQWLQGAVLWFQPIRPLPNWALKAPRIAGLASLSDLDAHTILEKGLTLAGSPLRPPMPSYHFTSEDAAAVIAYLRSGDRKQ
jgi:hypothetical protein